MIRSRLLFSLVVGASLALPAVALAQNPADVAAARDLFREGAKLAQEQRWNDARERYERSLALRRAPLTLYSLGVADQNLGRLVEALESFRAFLVELDPKSDAHKLYEEPARSAIAELEKRVGRIELRILPSGVVPSRIVVDGADVPKAAFGLARIVDPGEHVIVVSAEGRRDAQSNVRVGEGQQVTVDLKLLPPPGGPEKPHAGPIPDPTPPRPILPMALMGAGGAVFITGLAVGLIGVQKASDAPDQSGPAAAQARRLGLAGDIVSGIGLAALGAGVALKLVGDMSRGAPAKPAQVSVRPFVSAGLAGVVGRF